MLGGRECKIGAWKIAFGDFTRMGNSDYDSKHAVSMIVNQSIFWRRLTAYYIARHDIWETAQAATLYGL